MRMTVTLKCAVCRHRAAKEISFLTRVRNLYVGCSKCHHCTHFDLTEIWDGTYVAQEFAGRRLNILVVVK